MIAWTYPTPEAEVLAAAHGLLATLPKATYYDCTDPEILDFNTPLEALESWADGSDLLSNPQGITIVAYERKSTDDWVERQVDRVVDDIAEDFDQEFSDPEGDNNVAVGARVRLLFVAAIKALAEEGDVWHCEPCGKVQLEAQHVDALMREQNPQWYEENP